MSTKVKYFDGKLSKNFISLFTGRMLMFAASGLLGLFLPIFLFELFDGSYEKVFWFYGAASILYVLAMPIGVKFFDEKLGLQKSLRVSLIFLCIYYTCLYFVEPNTVQIFIPIGIFFLILFRILFWTPFRTDVTKFTDGKNRGRQMSSFEAIKMFLAVVLPLLAAFVIEQFSYDVLFVMAIILYLITIIPFRRLPPTKENFSWTYEETFKQYFYSLKNKKVAKSLFADGAETFVGLIIWPIFIFEILDGNLMDVGLVSAAIVLVTITLQLIFGKNIDKKMSKEKLLKWGSIFYSVGWIVKIFIITSFQVFIAGAYHSITKIFTRTPFDTLTYDLSSREGHYVDEYSVIMEMMVHTGRFVMMLVAILLINFLTIHWVFVIAALASLALNLMGAQDLYFDRRRKKTLGYSRDFD